MNILSAENLSFAVGHVALLDHASFQLDSGEKIGLIGRNGAGKSSFLKILAGTNKADDGQLIIQNSLKVVYVPQENFFNPEVSVFDTVAEGLGEVHDLLRRYYLVSQQLETDHSPDLLKQLNELQTALEAQNGWQFDAAIQQTLTQLGLPGDELIGNLSGGQQKRVALAQALVQKPDVLLLDEPTNHLDLATQEVLQDVLANYPGTIMLVSHDRYLIDALATQIWELDTQAAALQVFKGAYSEYKQTKEGRLQAKAVEDSPPAEQKPAPAAASAKSGLSRNQRQQLEKKLAALEQTIHSAEIKKAECEARLSKPTADLQALEKVTARYQAISQDLEKLMAEWEQVAERLHQDTS